MALSQNWVFKNISVESFDDDWEYCNRAISKDTWKLNRFNELLQYKHTELTTGRDSLVLGAEQGEMSSMNGRFYLIFRLTAIEFLDSVLSDSTLRSIALRTF